MSDYRDEDYPDPSDWADPDDPEGDQVRCPACRGWVYDDAEQCPRCGNWIVPGAGRVGPRGRLFLAVAVLMIVLILVLVLRGW
jgi:hypothetical protein